MKKKVARQKKRVPLLKNPKFMTMLIGAFIVLIMVGSALNMWKGSEEEDFYKIGELKFFNTESGWLAYKGEKRIILMTNPKDLENLTISKVDLNTLNMVEKIYLSVDPATEGLRNALYDFQRNIQLSPRIVSACPEDTPLCADMPLKNCSDATDTVGVILIQKSNQTSVSLEGNCLTIQGENLIKTVDKLILNYYT